MGAVAAVAVALLMGLTAAVGVGGTLSARTSPSSSAVAALPTDAVAVPAGVTPLALPDATHVAVTIVLAPGSLAAGEVGIVPPEPVAPGGFLTEPMFEATYGPPDAVRVAVASFLADHGATSVQPTPDGLGVRGVLTVGGVRSAFGVQLVSIGTGEGTPVYTAIGTPSVPPALRPWVVGLDGLSNAGNAAAHLELTRAHGPTRVHGTGASAFVPVNGTAAQLFVGSDYTQLYGVANLPTFGGAGSPATYANGTAVTTLLLSGYNDSTSTDLPGYDPVAVDAYFNDTFPAAWPHPLVQGVPVTLDNVTPPPPGGEGALQDTSLDATENALDIEMAGSLAPGATVVNFYFSDSLLLADGGSPPLGSIADDFAYALGDALAYNYSGARLTAVSNSFGLPDLNDSLWNEELAHAAALGVTVVAASGDQGDAPESLTGRFQGSAPTWPATAATDTAATVSVGGVTLTATGSPNGWYNGSDLNASYDPNVGAIAGATVWYDSLPGPGNVSGSEGGVSSVFPEPVWQLDSAAQPAIVNVTLIQGSFALGRAGPDLAFSANTTIAYTAHDAGGAYFDLLEGTSVSAPLFAGFLASCAAAAGAPFGALDPTLYRMASYFAAHPGNASPFLDVTSCANYLFAAAPGWDAATGWGGLDAPRFLAAIGNASVAGYVYTGPTPGLPPIFPTLNGGGGPPYTAFLIFGLAVTFAVLAILAFGRPKPVAGRPPLPPDVAPPPIPSGGDPGPPPVPPPGRGPPPVASFLCPYCGRSRPAEPVRCPSCGAF